MGKNNTQAKGARAMSWTTALGLQGWTCSLCEWNYPLPTLLSDPEAKTAYDRLASAKFRDHVCANYLSRLKTGEPASFTDRIRKLVSQGFKPKDAVEILLQEAELEHGGDPKMLEQARREGEDFLRRIREGLV
ncbi:MAG TPA: hypothetical protein VEH30_16805 [Terriglobales bacterium]|nr:hypothetical protein [Terriglobales bacterium]